MENRLKKLKEIWIKKVDSFLIVKLEEIKSKNLLYFTNFTSDDGFFLQTKNKNYLFAFERDKEQALREKFKDLKLLILNPSKRLFHHLQEIIKKEKLKSLGVEEDIPLSLFKLLKRKLKIKIKPLKSEEILKIRKIKEENEIKILKEAQKITDKIFSKILNYIIPEKTTEKELALKIYELAIKYGCDGVSFPPIIASGSASSIPHYFPQDKKIKNNSPLLIDFGVVYKNYVSDMTRTIWVGRKINEDFKKAYYIVLEAQKRAIEKCKFDKPIKAKEVDLTAREIIERVYKNKFIHSTGHGIGLEVHESPYLSQFSKEKLFGNEVVTIEPGVYLENKFGIRIEDTVITGSGEDITFSDKELIML